ncbi:3-hydroxyacyl-CoA dehydrogenase NAD-binding domain-containing protein [Lactiplantibacillus plantarum]|uniref:3-hydroxyacyl-CoA dehydrogenase NAD-binding domain-containing protein n=1 Tax=Lactiplantibacillus plantarum TaxID=1590 RepID=UPI004046734A
MACGRGAKAPRFFCRAAAVSTPRRAAAPRPDQTQRIRMAPGLDAAAACDLVIETVPENLELKRGLFAQLDALCKPEAIFATNTSGLSINAIASAVARRDRFVGTHFFTPADGLVLVFGRDRGEQHLASRLDQGVLAGAPQDHGHGQHREHRVGRQRQERHLGRREAIAQRVVQVEVLQLVRADRVFAFLGPAWRRRARCPAPGWRTGR